MSRKRKICVVTGSRAEYGLLYWLMKEIQEDTDLFLQIVATGSHFSPEFGRTFNVIEEDGFIAPQSVEMLLSSDSQVGIAKSIGLGVIGFADKFDLLKPDIIVLLGDRFEILAAAQAAMVARIPIAHLHGGEASEGAIDEAMRHSITKMSHLHFVSAEVYKRRVIQLGEDPNRVFNVGAMGLDNLKKLKLLGKRQFEKSLQFSLGKKNFLVTYHPATLNKSGPEKGMRELLKALDQFPESKIIFTKPNADTGTSIIKNLIDEYTRENPHRTSSFTTLGQVRYLSAIKHVDVIIGNSSSGLIEVPFLQKPTINLGDRQAGRLKASSVVDCEELSEKIVDAIRKVLSPSFQHQLKKVVSPYGTAGASAQVKEILKEVNLEKIFFKRFFDLKFKF